MLVDFWCWLAYDGSIPMPAETPHFDRYNTLVKQAEQHTLIALQGELLTSDATIELVLAALTAVEHGISRDEVVTALIEGEVQGVTLFNNLQTRNDPAYWEAVKEEAERYWAMR